MKGLKAESTKDGYWVNAPDTPPLGWAKARDCCFIGALEAALSVTEKPWPYADLMAVSGLAFRTRWFREDGAIKWCPSSPVGEFPDEISAVSRATGWKLNVCLGEANGDSRMEEAADKARASIDQGMPVLIYDASLNMGILRGYEEIGEKRFKFQGYFTGEKPIVCSLKDLGWMMILLEDFTGPMEDAACLKQSLSLAVSNWRKPRSPEAKHYLYGQEALEAWGSDLANDQPLTDEQRESLAFVNCWCYISLMDARSAAIAYLRKAASLKAEAAENLNRMADAYKSEMDLLLDAWKKAACFHQKIDGKYSNNWSMENRREAQHILQTASASEAAIIGEMEKLLTLL